MALQKGKSRSLTPICKNRNWVGDDTKEGSKKEKRKADPSRPFAKTATGFGMTPKRETRRRREKQIPHWFGMTPAGWKRGQFEHLFARRREKEKRREKEEWEGLGKIYEFYLRFTMTWKYDISGVLS